MSAAPIAFRGSWAPQAKNNAGKIDCFLLARKAEPCPASGLALCHRHPQDLHTWGDTGSDGITQVGMRGSVLG